MEAHESILLGVAVFALNFRLVQIGGYRVVDIQQGHGIIACQGPMYSLSAP